MPFDPDVLVRSIETYRQGGRTLSDVFVDAGVNEVSDEELAGAVLSTLGDRPKLIATWQGWSYDKRWSPSPYLDGLEVGHHDAGRQHVRRYADDARRNSPVVRTGIPHP
jgi:hypothetical protein